ncbi:BrxA/BrxB family bacilliredoxin [Edaphobacillus lindanitolerans]|uniref:Putative bacilliredoxin, YphP/YqiW family n=1 Tax=Edaphobacillus lindanitolerans TaxID=550447 RepID=A0A1U7PP42_9BACI|nr:BrxA/BrxB family bacilliredoxin [Edaphobacillus lindanitolerans]SIT80488.1 putative bacilliredoxin, YphP/YqiW family [Edaphobacillus lindanitolerans]
MEAYEAYMKQMAEPMRRELTENGFRELTTAEDVDAFMDNAEGISLVVINSVCGCAAGLARPAVVGAVAELEKKPDHLVTVFAGQDREATETMRGYLQDVPPSSPSIAIMEGSMLKYFIPREQIEDHDLEQVQDHLAGALRQMIG